MARFFWLLLLALPVAALADDNSALDLADQVPPTAPHARDWHVYTEGALEQADQRYGVAVKDLHRLTVDLRYEGSFGAQWRAVLADRFDQGTNPQTGQNATNTLKEAYVSWLPQTEFIADVGRVNPRCGVATGYNPTDAFRAHAIRAIDSVDPASLRDNRLGAVMLRSQSLWSSGSLTLLYAPKLAGTPSNATWSPDMGASNGAARWQLAATERLSPGFSPQLLLFGTAQQAPQLGFNATALVSNSLVAYLEWAGGRSRSQLGSALGLANDSRFRSRLATGATWSTASKLMLTLEYQYDAAALDGSAWNGLRSGSPLVYTLYRYYAQTVQDPPTRRGWFLYSQWQDAGLNHLDLTAIEKLDASDGSRLSWLEARYHWDRAELALQRQINSGARLSDFGGVPQARVWEVLARYYF